jgi:RNA polymerase sigma-70 factor (ECF subfamily)
MTEDPLIRFLKKRTRTRFTALVRATRKDILNAAWRVLGDLDRAEDVTQEVFLKLLTVKWDPRAIRSPRGLLISTALLAARTAAREDARRAARERRAGSDRLARAEGTREEDAAEVREAVAALPAELCESVELRYFGGLRIAEVAESMGWSLRTTNHRLKEARDRLRARLAAPAAAAVLPVVAGESEAAWPSVEVAPDLASRLERLSTDGPALARIARGKPLPAALLVPAAAVLLCLAGAAWIAGSRSRATEAPAIAALEDAATARGEEDARARREVPEEPGPRPRAGDEPAGGRAGAAPDRERPGTGGLSIEVVGEDGARIREGEIRLRPEPFDMPLDEIESLIPLGPAAATLETHLLAHGNPHELRGLPPCALSAQATVPGLPPSAREPFRIEAGRVTAVRLLLTRPRTLEARVIDRSTREPLAQARVVSVSETARRDLSVEEALLALEREGPPCAGLTGPDGSCRLEGLGAGLHRLEAYLDGYRTARLDGVDPARGAVLELEKRGPGGSIDVSARGPGGEPVARVSVTLEVEGEAAIRRVELDAGGRARFEGVPAGMHTVALDIAEWTSRILAERWEGLNLAPAHPVVIEDGGEASVELGFLRGTARVEALVVDGAGNPRAGVEVALSGVCPRQARTGSDGRAVFEEVPAGKWSARAGDSRWRSEAWSLGDLEARSVRLVLGDGAIRGRVSRGPDGAGAAGVLVSALGPASNMTMTGPDGSFAFEAAAPGRYTIHAASSEGEVPAVEAEVPLAGDAPAVEIRLEP